MQTAMDAPIEVRDKAEQSFVEQVRKHGWFGTRLPTDAEGPGFSYTSGFWLSTQNPEVIIFGMPNNAHDAFWSLFRDAKAGKSLPIGTRTRGVFGNAAAYAFPVSKRFYGSYLGWNRWFYGRDNFPCLQIVWPDPAGLFPWETGFDPALAGDQLDLTDKGWVATLAN